MLRVAIPLEPMSETTNDICIRWNAPLAYLAAYLGMTGYGKGRAGGGGR